MTVINSIKAGDSINVSLVVNGGGWELISTVTTSIDSTTGKTKYAITTTNRVLSLFEHQFQLVGSQTNLTNTLGVSRWVLQQSK